MTNVTDGAAIGADMGNATVSVASATGRIVFFPSFYARTRRPYQGTGEVNPNRHHITYQGTNYVIGIDALDLPGHDSLMAEALSEDKAHQRYLSDHSFAAFLAGVSALHPDADQLTIRLGTGAPLSVYEAQNEALRHRYIGTHEYAYLGRPRTLTVIDARVFGEGIAATSLLTPDQMAGNVAVHDIGGRTYGVIFFKNGTMKPPARAFDGGIDRLFNDIPIVSSDPGARWYIQHEMRRGKGHADLRREINQSIADMLATIETNMRLDLADRHVILGGGAVYAAPIIKARYKKPVIVLNEDAPESANAIGYAKAVEVL